MKYDAIQLINSIMRGIDRLVEWCLYAGAFVLLFLPIIMSYEVVMRYFFDMPTAWSVDFSEYIMVYLTFLSAGWLLRQKEHISMLFLYEHLGERNRKILDVVHSLLGFLVCLFLFWSGCSITRHAFENNVKIIRPQYINIHKFLILWVIPFCFLIFLIYFARDFFNSLADLKTRINAKIQETTSGRVIEDDNFREDQ